MLHLVVAAALKDVDEADQVAVDVGMRILDRVAHTGLGGQVDHLVELFLGEQFLHPGAVAHVELDETEARHGQSGASGGLP